MANDKILQKPPHIREEGEQSSMYPGIISSGTITTDQLAKEMSMYTPLTQSEVKSLITTLTDVIAYHLNEGYRVKLGEIGYFSARPQTRRGTDKNETTSRSGKIDNVNFKAAAAFRRRLTGNFQPVKEIGLRTPSVLTLDQKRELLLSYFVEEKKFITRKIYSSLTNTLKTKAWKELNGFVEEGIIKRKGKGNQLKFILPG